MARSRKLRKRESRPRRKTNKRGKKAQRAKTTKRAARRTRVKARRPRRHARVTRRRVHRKRGGTATVKEAYSAKRLDGSNKPITHTAPTQDLMATKTVNWGSFATQGSTPKLPTTTTKSSPSTSSKAFTSAQGNAVAASLDKDSGGMFSASYYQGPEGLAHSFETVGKAVGAAGGAALILRGAYGIYKISMTKAAVNQPISATGKGTDMGLDDPDQIGAPRSTDIAGSYGTKSGLKDGFGNRLEQLVKQGKAEQLSIGKEGGIKDEGSYSPEDIIGGRPTMMYGGKVYSMDESALRDLLANNPRLFKAMTNAYSWSQRGVGEPQYEVDPTDGEITVRTQSVGGRTIGSGDDTGTVVDTNTVKISRAKGETVMTIEGADGTTTLNGVTTDSLGSLDTSVQRTLLKAFGLGGTEAGTNLTTALGKIPLAKLSKLSGKVYAAAADVGRIGSTQLDNEVMNIEGKLNTAAATDSGDVSSTLDGLLGDV